MKSSTSSTKEGPHEEENDFPDCYLSVQPELYLTTFVVSEVFTVSLFRSDWSNSTIGHTKSILCNEKSTALSLCCTLYIVFPSFHYRLGSEHDDNGKSYDDLNKIHQSSTFWEANNAIGKNLQFRIIFCTTTNQ